MVVLGGGRRWGKKMNEDKGEKIKNEKGKREKGEKYTFLDY